MKKHTLATLAALMAATASAYADDTNYWGAPQTSNGSVNITNYWGIAPSGDASSGGSNSNTDWINAQPDATGASAQNDDWLAAGGQSDDALLKVSTRAASSDLTRAASSTDTGADTPALTRAASGKAAGTDATDATGSDTPSNATWVQTYPEPDNATWVKTYPDSDETASVDINGNADGSASRTVGSIDASVPTCLDINGSEYCTGGSNDTNGTPLMRSALKVDTSELTGDEKLACEAILCLSASAAAGGECQPSLSRYFSITLKTAARTARARGNFLKLCPKVADDKDMQTQIAQFVDGEYASISWEDYLSRNGNPDATSVAKAGEGTPAAKLTGCTEAEKGTVNGGGAVCNGSYYTHDPHWNEAPLNPYCLFGSQRCIYNEAELAENYMEGWVLVGDRFVPPEEAGTDTANNGADTTGTDTANNDSTSGTDTAASDTKTWPATPEATTTATADSGMSVEDAKRALLIQQIQATSGEAHRPSTAITLMADEARKTLQNASGTEADAVKRTLQANGVTLP